MCTPAFNKGHCDLKLRKLRSGLTRVGRTLMGVSERTMKRGICITNSVAAANGVVRPTNSLACRVTCRACYRRVGILRSTNISLVTTRAVVGVRRALTTLSTTTSMDSLPMVYAVAMRTSKDVFDKKGTIRTTVTLRNTNTITIKVGYSMKPSRLMSIIHGVGRGMSVPIVTGPGTNVPAVSSRKGTVCDVSTGDFTRRVGILVRGNTSIIKKYYNAAPRFVHRVDEDLKE